MEEENKPVKTEQSMEEESFMQLNYKDMKKWYNDNSELKEKYGRFPMFWQDLAEWDHWNEFKKIYIKEKEKKGLKEERRKKRESRWGKAENRMASSRWEHDEREIDPGLPVAIAASVISIEELQIIQFRMQMQELTDKIETVEADAARISNDPNRSPSPPPEYDKMGNRTNTRAQRMRVEYEKQREEIMDEVVKLNPILKAIQPKAHCQVKIYFPIKDYPDYNFLGLIIGPRGTTHRQLEQQTHCKIVIRGRGTGREGKSNYDLIAQDDDPHVMITGDNEDDVAEAERVINELLQPLDDDKNIHKQKQMKQLAELNGLHEMNARCPYCGMTGHDQFMCPNRPMEFANGDIKCEICGDAGHIARDCPNRNDKRRLEEHRRMNDEYTSFMSDLESGKVLGNGQQQQQQQQQQQWQQPTMNYYGYGQPMYGNMYGQQWMQGGY